jgi:hypothetical protein
MQKGEFFFMFMDKLERALQSLQAPASPPDSPQRNAEQEYALGARRALDELHVAENYFNSITDPDLIEYALYEIEAARRKYEYMMRKLRSSEATWENASEPLQ